jgi:Ser/Thr protein kinase RdoA (MazF antagonist)
MNEFNRQFEGLNDDQRQERYLRLAQVCLKHYSIGDGEIVFIAHNAGVTYRIETPPGKQPFLLKIDQFVGEEVNLAPAETLRSGLIWLDAIARQTTLVVQQPIPNHNGDFLTLVAFDDLHEPFYCSLQHWIDGKHPRDPSPTQTYQIGRMMAQLHAHGSQWTQGKTLEALAYDEA